MKFLTITLEKSIFNEIVIKKDPENRVLGKLHSAKAGIELAEHVSDDWAEDHEGRNNYDGNQHKNKCILDQALASFPEGKQHTTHLLSSQDRFTTPFIFVRLL